MRTLLLGAGNSRDKRVVHETTPDKVFQGLVTHDYIGDYDVTFDLDVLPYPLQSEDFDEIHAYEVLEHCGFQGNAKYFFDQFNEFHRILKPGGVFCGSVPRHDSIWAFGDPGHRRVLPAPVFNYLQESFYDQLGETPCADYRPFIKGWWEGIASEVRDDLFYFIVRKV
jgi:SAM-dependent methyltransferase